MGPFFSAVFLPLKNRLIIAAVNGKLPLAATGVNIHGGSGPPGIFKKLVFPA